MPKMNERGKDHRGSQERARARSLVTVYPAAGASRSLRSLLRCAAAWHFGQCLTWGVSGQAHSFAPAAGVSPAKRGEASRRWLADREAELLPVPYFHVVYTLPSKLRDIAYQNKRVVYDLLMKAAAETTLAIAANPRRLGARIGITAVTIGSLIQIKGHRARVSLRGPVSGKAKPRTARADRAAAAEVANAAS